MKKKISDSDKGNIRRKYESGEATRKETERTGVRLSRHCGAYRQDRVAEERETMMFHWRDGLYFERAADGSVQIIKKQRSGDVEIQTFEVIIDADGWASIVASVSLGGEGHGRFYEAQRFHASTGAVS